MRKLKCGSDGADWVEDGVDILTKFIRVESMIVGCNGIEDECQLTCGSLLWAIEVEVFEAISYLSSYCVTRLFVAETSLLSRGCLSRWAISNWR